MQTVYYWDFATSMFYCSLLMLTIHYRYITNNWHYLCIWELQTFHPKMQRLNIAEMLHLDHIMQEHTPLKEINVDWILDKMTNLQKLPNTFKLLLCLFFHERTHLILMQDSSFLCHKSQYNCHQWSFCKVHVYKMNLKALVLKQLQAELTVCTDNL